MRKRVPFLPSRMGGASPAVKVQALSAVRPKRAWLAGLVPAIPLTSTSSTARMSRSTALESASKPLTVQASGPSSSRIVSSGPSMVKSACGPAPISSSATASPESTERVPPPSPRASVTTRYSAPTATRV